MSFRYQPTGNVRKKVRDWKVVVEGFFSGLLAAGGGLAIAGLDRPISGAPLETDLASVMKHLKKKVGVFSGVLRESAGTVRPSTRLALE